MSRDPRWDHPCSTPRTSETAYYSRVVRSATARCGPYRALATTARAAIVRGDGRPAAVGVEKVKPGREFFEHSIDHHPNAPQRMLRGYPLFRRKIAEHGGLRRIISTHRVLLQQGGNSRLKRFYPMRCPSGHQKQSFSTTC